MDQALLDAFIAAMGKKSKTKKKSGTTYYCQPVLADGPCNRGKHGAKTVQRACEKCGERRCKDHCLCARKKRKQLGRDCSQQSALTVQLPVATARAAEAAQADLPSCKEMDGEGHLVHLVKDLGQSVDCTMAMYTYDDAKLHSAVLAHLRKGHRFRLCVDKRYVLERPKLQALLSELLTAKAEVFLGKGFGKFGSMHLKISQLTMKSGETVVFFYGSANATWQSRSNEESVLRMTGDSLVAGIVKRLEISFARAKVYKQ